MEIDGYGVDGDFSGGHISLNSHTIYQHNGFMSLINSNNSDDIDINNDLKNGDVSYIIILINSHTLSQCNGSI